MNGGSQAVQTPAAPILQPLLEQLVAAPVDVALHLEVACAFAAVGHGRAAAWYFLKGVSLVGETPLPGREVAAAATVNALRRSGQPEDAVRLARRELAVAPGAALRVALGWSLLALGHLARAELAFREALAAGPEDAEVRYDALWGLSEALLRLWRLDGAAHACRDLAAAAPDRTDAPVREVLCAWLAGRAGDGETIRRLRSLVAALGLDAQDMLGRPVAEVVRADDVVDVAVAIASAAGDDRAAEAVLTPAADGSAEAEALWRRGLCRLRLGEWRAAVEDLWAVLALRPLEPVVPRTLGRCQEELGQVEEAATAYRYAANLAEDGVEAWMGLARTALTLGRLEEAAQAAARARALDAECVEAALLQGRAWRALGRLQEAYEALAGLLNHHPERRDVREALLDVLLEAEEFELAAAVANEALAAAEEHGLSPWDAPLCRRLAGALAGLGRAQEARQLREVAALLDPEDGTPLQIGGSLWMG